MKTFFIEYLWLLGTIGILTLIGANSLYFIKKEIKYNYLTLPFIGIALLILGISFLYSIVGLTFSMSTLAIFLLGIFGGFISIFYNCVTLTKDDFLLLLLLLFFAAYLVYVENIVSIKFGAHGFLFMDGSDQLGYAQLADWVRTHLASTVPKANANYPYQSWPALVLKGDARFGSYYLLASVSLLRNLSGMFGYDFATTVVFFSVLLAISATYANSKKTFLLLFVGLLISFWFEYSRSGYLGKIFGYPSILLLFGLAYKLKDRLNTTNTIFLVVLASALATAYPGTTLGEILILIGLIYFAYSLIYKKERSISYLLATLGFISILTTGWLAIPNSQQSIYTLLTFNSDKMDWFNLLARLYEVQSSPYIDLKFSVATLLLLFQILFTISLLVIAYVKKNIASLALSTTAIFLFLLFFALNKTWPAYQLTGLFYPMILCSGILLIDSAKRSYRYNVLIFSILALSLIVKTPLYISALKRYINLNNFHQHMYSQEQMNTLANLINSKTVTVKLNQSMLALPILVEISRDNKKIQWSPETWNVLFAYRNWPTKKLKKTHLLLTAHSEIKSNKCSTQYQTNQYTLLYCK